ncbi:MAG: sulfurtransferase TusA [Halieaceae bacterium]|jgi:tRNA 2-thiouridine synthesizing protein A|nr:sulfurtransferase TusA [Halieaceae bacterium]
MSGSENYAETIDAVGLRCPEPVMMLHAAIRRAKSGDLLQLVATDPSTQRDVANFCRFLPHELVSSEERGDNYVYVVRKGA